ncbi:AP2/B3-like transcriptional factor family protein, putative isoform 1 [Hibiscus syriacus]|uniref:AP2/B3-like transcriptional factor family protein, putative isoform 1 n=1 Tax=Hibiscus syriacus TaxID=106335 RepID=A0A6A3BKC2_HIBSY|nr:AP2/B3-like transcriptional factor family protein, putative isoform 1 [Hibiscus syriacus]
MDNWFLQQGIYGCPRKVVRKRPRDKNYTFDYANSPVVKRAEEVQANLSPEFPSFFKIMIPSVVCRGFWMSLPKEFCQLNLPSHDGTVILVDDTGKEYRITFLVQRKALSGGWKKFSEEHGLLVGDAVLFQLIRPSKFKVYIVRMNGLAEIDAAISLLRLKSSVKQTGICRLFTHRLFFITIHISYIAPQVISLWSSGHISQDINQYEVHRNGRSYLRAEENQSENGSLDVGSGEEKAEFVQSRADLNIDIVNIADAVRAFEVSTSRADFATSENSSTGLELLDVDGGLHHLQSLNFESKQVVKSRRSLELELSGKKEEMQRLDAEIEGLTVNSKRYKLIFEAAANAPW